MNNEFFFMVSIKCLCGNWFLKDFFNFIVLFCLGIVLYIMVNDEVFYIN